MTADVLKTDFKFVHAADLHLDSPLKNLARKSDLPVDELRQASRDSFENLINFCLEEQVDFLLLAGDLYDGEWRDVQPAIYLGSALKRLSSAGIPTYIILGNHDYSIRHVEGFRTFVEESAVVFPAVEAESRIVPGLAVAIHGQSFAARDVTTNLARSYPDPRDHFFNIGLLHTALDGREGHDNYAPVAPAELSLKGYDYWALGHIHNREVVHEDPHIVFPGNLHGRSIKEQGPKGAYLAEVKGGELVQLNFKELSGVRWTEILVRLQDGVNLSAVLEDCCQAAQEALLEASGKRLIARFTLDGILSFSFELLTEGLAQALKERFGRGVFLERVEVKARLTTTAAIDQEDLALFFEDLNLSGSELKAMIEQKLACLTNKIPAKYREEVLSNDLPEHDIDAWREEGLALLNEIQSREDR